MPTMKTVQTSRSGVIEVVEVERPVPGPPDVLIQIFEVTPRLAEHQDRFARLISHRVPFTDVHHAFQLALTPGAAEKIIVAVAD
jgi:threonine dehydrogenase-like Zn-dependent dehydrogenase